MVDQYSQRRPRQSRAADCATLGAAHVGRSRSLATRVTAPAVHTARHVEGTPDLGVINILLCPSDQHLASRHDAAIKH
jgi:hypothetical protein